MNTHRLFSALSEDLIPTGEFIADMAFDPGALRWIASYESGAVDLLGSSLPLSEEVATRGQIGALWTNVMGPIEEDETEDIDPTGRYAIRWNEDGDVIAVIVLYELRVAGKWTPIIDLKSWLAVRGVHTPDDPNEVHDE